MRRLLPAAAGAAALAMTLAGCGGNDPQPRHLSKPKPTASTSAAKTTGSHAQRAAWTRKYSTAQMADFHQALARYREFFDHHSEPFADPDPQAAVPIVKEYFAPAEGAYQLRLLKWAKKKHQMRADGMGRIVWVRMSHYGKTTQGQPQLTMRQCTDYSRVHGWDHGKPTPRTWDTPVIYTVVMGRSPDGKWLIARTVDPGIDKVKAIPCHG